MNQDVVIRMNLHAGIRFILITIKFWSLKIKFEKENYFMKKTRFLVLALAVAIMMMGAGYAWWNETVVITSKVDTGYLNVDIEGITTTPDDGVSMDYNFSNTCGTSATLKFIDLYPGKGGTAVITFKNNSSMPVKLAKDVKFSKDFTDEGNWLNPFDNENVAITVATALGTYALDPGTNKFTYDAVNPIVVPVGGTITFTVTAVMDGPSNDNDTQNRDQMGFVLEPTFVQHNQP